MSIFLDFVRPILEALSGFSHWVAIAAVAAILLYWWFSGKSKKERPRLVKRLVPVICIIGAAVLVIATHWLFFREPLGFPKGKTGILVAQIEGDDERNGIQRDLVSTLNTELRKDSALRDVEARPLPRLITEAQGHEHARQIGKECRAALVLWGSRGSDIRERIIHPRITVMPQEYVPFQVAGEHLEAQIMDEIQLPPVLVDRPIFLVNFVLGQSYYDQYRFEDAENRFEKCLEEPQEDIAGQNTVRAWVAMTKQALGRCRGRNVALQDAIEIYSALLFTWTEKDFPVDWAKTQNNLGLVYSALPTGDRAENLNKAIQCYRNALRVFTEESSPYDFAIAQGNLNRAMTKLQELQE